jgi:transposase
MSRSRQKRPRAAARLASGQDAGAHVSNPPAQRTNPDPAQVNTTRATAAADTPTVVPVAIGVGIDTSRYGHHATFLRADLQPAAADLHFVESALGYQQFRHRLDAIAGKHAGHVHVHFHIRLDIAGRYADNLLAFLHELATPRADAAALANAGFTISCGDPQRNKNYRVAIFGHKKSDPVESAACARYALTEKPKPTAALTPQLRLLCQIASRLESQARQDTRLINQLHNLLARTFPELALVVNDLSTGWILALLDRYPTAVKLAKARADALERIPYLPHEHIPMLVQQARGSVACLTGLAAEELVRDLVGQVKDARIRHKSLEKLLVQAYRDLPFNNHLDSIKGFGEVTAAILTAKIVDPHRFVEPGKLVGHFGIYPVEASSGIDRDGNPRLPRRMIMSKRGNDLVRRYLWMAALSAAQHNPAVKPLYQRVRAKHPDQPSIAIGHVMRKLLHIALAVWKSGKPFDPEHYPWDQPAHPGARGETTGQRPDATGQRSSSSDMPLSATPQAAGHNNPGEPERSVVTAACGTTSVPQGPAAGNAAPDDNATASPARTHESDIPMSLTAPPDPPAQAARLWIDFEHVKSQLPLERVLAHIGLLPTLRGTANQRRGPCPLHDHGNAKGRTFSVQLDKNVFQCFDVRCAKKGDAIDLWAAVKGMNLRDAAVDLLTTFNLEPAPRTEKRNG